MGFSDLILVDKDARSVSSATCSEAPAYFFNHRRVASQLAPPKRTRSRRWVLDIMPHVLSRCFLQ